MNLTFSLKSVEVLLIIVSFSPLLLLCKFKDTPLGSVLTSPHLRLWSPSTRGEAFRGEGREARAVLILCWVRSARRCMQHKALLLVQALPESTSLVWAWFNSYVLFSYKICCVNVLGTCCQIANESGLEIRGFSAAVSGFLVISRIPWQDQRLYLISSKKIEKYYFEDIFFPWHLINN